MFFVIADNPIFLPLAHQASCSQYKVKIDVRGIIPQVTPAVYSKSPQGCIMPGVS